MAEGELGSGWTDGRPEAPAPESSRAAPGPPANRSYRPGSGRLEGPARLAGATAVAALLALLGGCAASSPPVRYDNGGALASTVRKPVAGAPEDRTYRSGRYRGASFAGVRVLPPELDAPAYDDAEYQDFLTDLREALRDGTALALASVPHLGPVRAGEAGQPGGGLVCRVQALAHVTPTGHPVHKDPVFRDPRPKLVVVYRLDDAATGEAVFRYTSVGVSRWEYGPWAMEDLRAKALEMAAELRETLLRQ